MQNGYPNRAPLTLPITKALGTYVYALSDPRNGQVFYVGKGAGNRIFDHFAQADPIFNAASSIPANSDKLDTICAIWRAGHDVQWDIVAFDISAQHAGVSATPDELAEQIELACYQVLRLNGGASFTGNRVAPPLRFCKPALTSAKVMQLGWPRVNPSSAYPLVFAFEIHKAVAQGRDLYDATRQAWYRVAAAYHERNAMAVGIDHGHALAAFQVDRWDSLGQRRFAFRGRQLSPHELAQTDWTLVLDPSKKFRQRGEYTIVKFDGAGNFQYVRGERSPKWRPL